MAKGNSNSGKKNATAPAARGKKEPSYKETGKTAKGLTIDFSPAEALEKAPQTRKRR